MRLWARVREEISPRQLQRMWCWCHARIVPTMVVLFGKPNDPRRHAKRPIDSNEVRLATIFRMPLTVFDIKGVPGNRRERIEAAVVGGGKQARGPHEAWIAANPFKGGFRVLITGPWGFERIVVFDLDDDSAEIARRVRETLEE